MGRTEPLRSPKFSPDDTDCKARLVRGLSILLGRRKAPVDLE
ncbi:hypothetical protein M595_4726 [Lyngbya aestuarii BL J]|uniref:Uncharacterized protein n=1 Tax=Lyngbya aestuarii BL J TaxID=1348334 RepID=U7QDK0_9CYAN|nr:hypothetical protein M595_4726 [Lyngbya aestuarii BL J]